MVKESVREMFSVEKYRLAILCWILLAHASAVYGQSEEDIRLEYLEELIQLQENPPSDDFVTVHDAIWLDWVERTGALPPDFSKMPSIPLLPNPLVIDEGGENIPIETREQWNQKKQWILKKAQHILSGTFPPPPENVIAHVLEERMENGVKIEMIELRFGEDNKAKLTLELFTPSGEGPFPVFMTQWNHRGWVQIAVRRGYMGLVYAGADAKDDTREYLELWPDYDWSTLMTRAWGAHRAVDYLYTLDRVDRSKIAISGHSRNGKQAVFAGAYDDRITAVISSSGGTGGEIPYRYTDARHFNEDIEFLVSRRTHWLHPNLRFYWGREHKMPIDQNSLLSLITPNSLLLTSSIREGNNLGDPWAIEHNYQSLKKVYEFLDASEKLGIRLRDGHHGVEARDIEEYMDWLDIQFDRTNMIDWRNELVYNYSFDTWKELSGETVIPENFQMTSADRTLQVRNEEGKITSADAWKDQKNDIQEDIKWLLGDEPAGVSASPIRRLTDRDDYIISYINRPEVSNGSSSNIFAMGDYLIGRLYYPTDTEGEMETGEDGQLPVVIYLHRFSNTGFDARNVNDLFEDMLSKGMAVLAMDLIGYGTRIEEGTNFYERYPHWSKLGKMVTDTRAAVDALESLDFVDRDRIFLAGYALGGTVSLFTAALDERIAGTAVSGAFTPLRNATDNVEGLKTYSHLHGLIPRLGFFVGHENRIPVDFPEILSSIAPRPLLVITPELDRHVDFENVQQTINQVQSIYEKIFEAPSNLQFQSPHEFTGFSCVQQENMVEWLDKISRQLKN